jgi:uncharacterized protein YcbX
MTTEEVKPAGEAVPDSISTRASEETVAVAAAAASLEAHLEAAVEALQESILILLAEDAVEVEVWTREGDEEIREAEAEVTEDDALDRLVRLIHAAAAVRLVVQAPKEGATKIRNISTNLHGRPTNNNRSRTS